MALREILVSFGFDVDNKKLKAASSSVDEFKKGMKPIAGFVAGAFAFGAVKDFARELVNVGDEIGDVSEQLGISGADLQKWRFVAESGGASAQALATGLRVISKQAVAASEGSVEASADFKALGITVTDASGAFKTPTKLFEEAGVALARVDDVTQRNVLAMKLFGKSGQELVPVFKNGARGVEELKNRFDELGGGLSEGALGVLGETDQKLRENEVAIRSFKGALVSTFGPGVNKVLEKGTKWVAQLDKTEEGTAALKAGVLGLGVVAGGMALAAVGAFGAALGSAVAVTAEWFNILNGGPTIIGAVMEALGDKSAPQVMEDIASGWSRIVKDMREAKGLEGVLAVVGETAERKSQDLGRAFKSEELSGRLEELRRGRNREGREIGDLQEINDVALKLALDAKEHATRGTAFKGIGAQFKTAGLVKEARAINAVPDQLAQSAFAATAGISPFASLAAPLATAATAGATKEIRVDSKPSIQINQTVTVASVEEADALASATKDGALRGVTDGANAMHAALTTAAK